LFFCAALPFFLIKSSAAKQAHVLDSPLSPVLTSRPAKHGLRGVQCEDSGQV